MRTAHDILVEARNRIDRHGWANYCSSHGSYCTGLAISASNAPARFDAYAALKDVLGFSEPGLVRLYDWNDAPGRTKDEVLALFDEAIGQTAPAPDTGFLDDRVAKTDQDTKFWTGVVS